VKKNLDKSPKHNHKRKAEPNSLINCVDLFCGAGGLTCGLVKKGIKVVAGVDLDPQCIFPYEYNNRVPFIQKDVSTLSSQEIIALFGDSKYRLLAGCAPCQPFSTYSRKSRQNRNDTKWDLVAVFGHLVKHVQPDLVTMENVPQLLNHDVFRDFLASLKGYEMSWQIVDCTKYGVPQTRKRLVLLASKLGSINLVDPTSFGVKSLKTVRQTIAHLPVLEAGCTDPRDSLHVSCSLSELNLRRIKASKPGGTWRDWDKSLLAECHRKTTGQTYPSVYGRMEWDAPAPTMTTQCFGFGNGRFGHPEQDRAISLREAATLQTFPENYYFLPPGEHVCFDRIGRLIGNAVPVRIGEVIGQSLIEHVRQLEV
jgi:DNA (cytosine-5)-methyltransferase 1